MPRLFLDVRLPRKDITHLRSDYLFSPFALENGVGGGYENLHFVGMFGIIEVLFKLVIKKET